jgi:pimeloyl-ACP methyl ester carboxylesterase
VHDLGVIRVPTLLVIGQDDHTAPGKSDVAPEVAATLGNYRVLGERAAQAIPGARLVRIEGTGHLPQYEAFERYFEALSAFLPVARAVPRSAPSRSAPSPAASPGK